MHRRITVKESIFIQMDGYIDFIQDFFKNDESDVFMVDEHQFDDIMKSILVTEIDAELARELVNLNDHFNINIDADTPIIFFRD